MWGETAQGWTFGEREESVVGLLVRAWQHKLHRLWVLSPRGDWVFVRIFRQCICAQVQVSDLGITQSALALSVPLVIFKRPRISSGEVKSSQVCFEPLAQPGYTCSPLRLEAAGPAGVSHARQNEMHIT